MSTAAARKNKSREREREGLVWLGIETDRAKLTALLEELKLLDGMEEETSARLAHGLEQLLHLLFAARDSMPGENVIQ